MVTKLSFSLLLHEAKKREEIIIKQIFKTNGITETDNESGNY